MFKKQKPEDVKRRQKRKAYNKVNKKIKRNNFKKDPYIRTRDLNKKMAESYAESGWWVGYDVLRDAYYLTYIEGEIQRIFERRQVEDDLYIIYEPPDGKKEENKQVADTINGDFDLMCDINIDEMLQDIE